MDVGRPPRRNPATTGALFVWACRNSSRRRGRYEFLRGTIGAFFTRSLRLDGLPTDELTAKRYSGLKCSRNSAQGDTQNPFAVDGEQGFTHLAFQNLPGCGVARLRIYGEVVPDWPRLKRIGGDIDLAAVENGGLVSRVATCFLAIVTISSAGRALNMSDGWEPSGARTGNDWSIIKLGAPGKIRRVKLIRRGSKETFRELCA